MLPLGWSVLIDLAGADVESLGSSTVAVLDLQGVATHDHCDAMEWVDVPRGGLPRFKNESPDEGGSMLEDRLDGHQEDWRFSAFGEDDARWQPHVAVQGPRPSPEYQAPPAASAPTLCALDAS